MKNSILGSVLALVFLTSNVLAADRDIYDCLEGVKQITQGSPEPRLNLDFDFLRIGTKDHYIFSGKMDVNGVLSEGFFVADIEPNAFRTVFVPLNGDGPHLVRATTPLFNTINVTAVREGDSWILDAHANNKYGFFRPEGRTFYSLNQDHALKAAIKNDDLFEANYKQSKQRITKTDDETRAAFLTALTDRILRSADQCFETPSKDQIAKWDKQLADLQKERAQIGVRSRTEPSNLPANLGEAMDTTSNTAKLEYMGLASRAFNLDQSIRNMDLIVKTAKRKRNLKFREKYPSDQVNHLNKVDHPICPQKIIEGVVSTCANAISKLSISQEKKEEILMRFPASLRNPVSSRPSSTPSK